MYSENIIGLPWSCNVCTYTNDYDSENCLMCNVGQRPQTNVGLTDLDSMSMSMSRSMPYLTSLASLTSQLGLNQMDQSNNQIASIFRSLSGYSSSLSRNPRTVEELTCQVLYHPDVRPHYCLHCCTKGFIRYGKILDLKANGNEHQILQMVPPDSIAPFLQDDNRQQLLDQIFQILNTSLVPTLLDEAAKSYYEIYSSPFAIDSDSVNVIWDTIHRSSSSERLSEIQIKLELQKLLTNQEFLLYCNGYETETFNHPASKQAIEKIPTLVAKSSKNWDVLQKENCSICQDEFKEETIIMELSCHTFCKECIGEWLKNHNDTCPVCRTKVI